MTSVQRHHTASFESVSLIGFWNLRKLENNINDWKLESKKSQFCYAAFQAVDTRNLTSKREKEKEKI